MILVPESVSRINHLRPTLATVRNTETNVTRTMVTDGEGVYRFLNGS